MKKIILCMLVFVFCASVLFSSTPKPDNLKLISVVPKIFSPQESSSSKVRFTYNYNGTDGITVGIYDVSGAMVCRNVERESDTVMYWDGTDNDGNFVKSGIYIYQIEAGKNVLSGTVIVAR